MKVINLGACFIVAFAVVSCSPLVVTESIENTLSPIVAEPTIHIATKTSFTIPPTRTKVSPTHKPTPQGITIIVTSVGDSGPGTLRQALLDAQSRSSDIITFDPTVFPPGDPATILLKNKDEDSALPNVFQGGLTIDASNAGVILDGSNTSGDWVNGLEIYSSRNIVRGLQIINFTGSGIALCGGSNNMIGGDRRIGEGPIGQGNLTSNNGIGIDLCDWGSHNTVTGNLVGTDPSTTENWGNKGAGIEIENGLTHNRIGPDNIIAHNIIGIRITGSKTFGNTITQNSIYDNYVGIRRRDRGNIVLDSPQIFGFDIDMGSVTGTACANCTVEIFSDRVNEGKLFEGQTQADSSGAFTYEHGVSFSGPYLTATATDADGSTSEFSFVLTHAMRLQEGNTHAIIKLQHKPSNELEDNRLGDLWHGFWQLDDFQAIIDSGIIPMGLKHVKMSINEGEYFTNAEVGVSIDWSKPELSIPPKFDNYVTDLVSHDIIITYVLIFWDKANHPEGWEVQSRFKTEEEISRYLEYVRFIVSKFKGRVRYYELWNEPNIKFPLQHIEPADYINLAKRTIPVIKQIDPQAKIVVGSTSGSADAQAREYLFKILTSDLMPMADVVAWHPLFGDVPDSEQSPGYYETYPSLLAEIMSTAKRNGFQGEFKASEITYKGPGCGGCDINDPFFSDIVAAKYTARGIILHLGNGVSSGAGGTTGVYNFFNNTIRNMANIFAGASADAFAVEIQTDAQNIKAFTFTKTDGSKLVAIWTDGVAVENDSGMLASLTIPSFSADEVKGIDVLYGFEQELITSMEDGNIVIRDLLVKDYPIILRLTDNTSP
jgi:hypothetical protein